MGISCRTYGPEKERETEENDDQCKYNIYKMSNNHNFNQIKCLYNTVLLYVLLISVHVVINTCDTAEKEDLYDTDEIHT